jgi:hypothetical protein
MMNKLAPPAIASILFLVALNSADVLTKWWVGMGPAVKWQGVDVVSKIVHPGGTIEVVYTAMIQRQCPSELRGFVVAPDGTVPVRFPPVSGGYTPPNEEPVNIRVSVTMPKASDSGLSKLQSGEHVYRTVATRFCQNGVEVDNDVPDAKFFLEVP